MSRPLTWLSLSLVLVALILAPLPGNARSLAQKKQQAKSDFERAEQLREALNGRPAKQRSARDYERVINAYRSVYYTAPTSNKADASALAVAELLAESARAVHKMKDFHASIEQYEFLRREYPGSKYRMGALFSIGQIYREDLLDYDKAQATFQDFLKHYPSNHLAEQARSAIAEMQAELAAARTKANSTEAVRNLSVEDTRSKDTIASKDGASKEKDPFHTGLATGGLHPAEQGQEQRHPLTPVSSSTTAPKKHSQLTMVTGIRHWSTPDYTRIAIDIDEEVQYEAGRVPSPDRIFFDLDSTRLAPELAGKSFDVQDGFLKKVRVAQFKSDKTRVVLEVDQLADYSAFLLPNPYRLIIDIHGKQSATTTAKKKIPETRATPTQNATAQTTAGQTTIGPNLPSQVPLGQTAQSQPSSGQTGTVAASSHEAGSHETRTKDNANTSGFEHKDKNTTTQTASVPAASRESRNQNAASDRPESLPATVNTQIADKTERSSNLPISDKAAEVTGNETADSSVTSIGSKDVSASKDSSSKDTGSGEDLNMNEIAGLNQQPDEVKATDRPTSGPIAQSVAPRQTSGTHEKGDASESDDSKITVHKTKRSGVDLSASREARPNASGDRSLIRALGLKIGKIVIDAGHGGHDTGTIGPGGLQEKDLVLEVALRLGKLLQSQLGAEVVYTRSDDTFIPLETRTAIANKQQADLFISIHANSSHDPSARGIETYYLNFTASPDAMEVAARENAVSEKSIHELQDLVKKITLKEKIEESREFAADVQDGLYQGFASKAGMKNRGVKKAPFIVLIGANMPSILAEISFVSNPRDEKKLRTPDYRQKIAESLGRGVEKYIAGLSGVKLAANAATPPSLGGN